MKRLNFIEMENVNAGGCGWLKRQSRRAGRDGDWAAAVQFANAYIACKMQ